GLVVLRLLRGAEDEVHVRVESLEDPAVPATSFQLNHHVRVYPLVEKGEGFNHRTSSSERGALLKGLRARWNGRFVLRSLAFRGLDEEARRAEDIHAHNHVIAHVLAVGHRDREVEFAARDDESRSDDLTFF